ncbi:uncharacterized protein LOC132262631 [Phlebotomus argentipes]|uniref:uncharacterized protein LOC132262631 n=1 Tax=Phlebotomus argentipes TaxID=94469 RepID=UPI002892E4C2|nr:uncharacterized protein LOC132262631 [Phlebotomus argentipes]
MSIGEKMSQVKPLLKLSSDERKQFLDSFDIMMADCDGVLWNLFSPIPGTGETLNTLDALGKKIIYMSNNSIRTEKNYEDKVTKIGFKFERENLVHPIAAIIRYLKKINFQGLIYMIGTTYTKTLVREAGFRVIDGPNVFVEENFTNLVKNVKDGEPVKFVIMDVDFNFGYPKYLRAELYLRHPECQLIVAATDHRLPVTDNFNLPGPGYFVDALVACLPPGKKPIVLGKPGKKLGEVLRDQFDIKDPKRVLFVGDMINPDIKFARNVGYQSLLVLSGGTSPEEMLANTDESAIPDFCADSLADLSTLIKNAAPQSTL